MASTMSTTVEVRSNAQHTTSVQPIYINPAMNNQPLQFKNMPAVSSSAEEAITSGASTDNRPLLSPDDQTLQFKNMLAASSSTVNVNSGISSAFNPPPPPSASAPLNIHGPPLLGTPVPMNIRPNNLKQPRHTMHKSSGFVVNSEPSSLRPGMFDPTGPGPNGPGYMAAPGEMGPGLGWNGPNNFGGNGPNNFGGPGPCDPMMGPMNAFPGMPPMGMGPPNMWGPWNMNGGMMGDMGGGMMGDMGGGMMGDMGGGMQMGPPEPQPQLEIIKLENAVLYPPPQRYTRQTTREKPSGCKTIFVGGVPDNVTERILHELFERCGPISNIRISKKNFAHIRFEEQESVDKALFYSGYRMVIDDKDDKENTGKLHVDYAQARDDHQEYQRRVEREARHRERSREFTRPPSPVRVAYYSDHEAHTILDNLKSSESFEESMNTLRSWLERGDCNRKNAGTFYSLVQGSNSHIKRLMTEKSALNDEREEMRMRHHEKLESIISQLEHIDKVFSACFKQKLWDHFTKAQRKNIEVWRKQLKDWKAVQVKEFMKDCGEEDMELSDSEDHQETKKRKVQRNHSTTDTECIDLSEDQDIRPVNQNAENEISTLKCQLEAYKNEVDLVKSEAKKTDETKDKQIKDLQNALQGMQQQLISSSQTIKKIEENNKQLQSENKTLKQQTPEGVVVIRDEDNRDESSAGLVGGERSVTSVEGGGVTDTSQLQREARVISLVVSFLLVHPTGASIDYIWSYLNRHQLKIRSSQLEDLLDKYPSVFSSSDPPSGQERKWMFIGFNEPSSAT